ncbi:glycosyltransferase family 2 protein [Deinococcus misasensis]|uniref:glycosyltransferase family 2 protein n=1 Tax=Deinococcus misasensis TaxID=392413 RepID=UPI000554A125|nr:glycosyltransferase family 2 protein [Deinococcus misasensis]
MLFSICIPTYNRSVMLQECLDSVLKAIETSGLHHEVEILISDNCSPDRTPEVVGHFLQQHGSHLNIQSFRHPENLGAEMNFWSLISRAKGDFIWMIGDDDRVYPQSLQRVHQEIQQQHPQVVAFNYDVWSKDFSEVKKARGLKIRDHLFQDRDQALSEIGLNMGYITAVVFRRDLLKNLSLEDYQIYAPYGFAFAYAIFAGLPAVPKVVFRDELLVMNRAENSGGYNWYKYFVQGSCKVFEGLRGYGYGHAAIEQAKRKVIRQYVIHDLLIRRRDGVSIAGLYETMLPLYRNYPEFWLVVVPLLKLPRGVFTSGWTLFRNLRGWIKQKRRPA